MVDLTKEDDKRTEKFKKDRRKLASVGVTTRKSVERRIMDAETPEELKAAKRRRKVIKVMFNQNN